MDTKSTNFNFRFFVKIVAVILALTVVFFSAKDAFDGLTHILNQEILDDDYYLDGIFITQDEDVYTSSTFDRYIKCYLNDLNRFVLTYGDGTKESYENFNEKNKAEFERYKENLLTNIYNDVAENEEYSYSVFCLLDMGVITLKQHTSAESGDEHYIDLYDEDYEWELYSLCEEENGEYSEVAFESNAKKANALGGELILELPLIEIEREGKDITFKPGSYILDIDEEVMKQVLIDYGMLGYFGSYEEYKNAVKADSFKTSYKNINYVVTLSDGTVVTNVKNYPDNQSSISQYEFYLTGSDGVYNSNKGAVYYFEEIGFFCNSYNDFYIRFEHGHISKSASQTVHTTLSNVTVPTAYEETEVTTMKVSYDIKDVEDYELAVYFNSDAIFYGESFSQIKTNLLNAGTLSRSVVFDVIFGVGFYLIMLVLLMVLSGRRSREDEEVYLLPTDKIFIEIKLLISGALIFLAGCAAVVIIDEDYVFSYNLSRFLYYCLPLLVAACAGILMEFILSVTKNIKAKRFLKSFLIVWFIKVVCLKAFRILRKLWGVAGKALRKLWNITVRFIKAIFSFISIPFRKLKKALDSDKLYYAKNVEQTVKIKTAILIAANLPFAFLCFCVMFFFNGIDDYGEVLLLGITGLPAMALDVLALIRGLSFVGGVSRISDVIKEYRKGNLDAPINRAGLPPYLIETGENLESLSEGIKLAVAEAVKQETTKTELITNISHDLKTPLTSIINYVDLLKKYDIKDETAMSYLEVLGEKSDRLKTLISDLVEASKAATGNVDVNFVDISLKEILTQLTGEFSDAFSENNLEVILSVPDSDIIVSADNRLLYRAFENLAINIKKYSMPSTRVYISAEKKEDKGIVVFKNISNEPLNISPEELKQRFVRGDTSRATDGNGLGLSIAENLCTVQGGTLDIDIMGDLFIARVELKCK